MLSYDICGKRKLLNFVKIEMKLQHAMSCQDQKLVLQDSDQNLCRNGIVLFHILDARAFRRFIAQFLAGCVARLKMYKETALKCYNWTVDKFGVAKNTAIQVVDK